MESNKSTQEGGMGGDDLSYGDQKGELGERFAQTVSIEKSPPSLGRTVKPLAGR